MDGEASVAPAETKSLRTCDIFFCCSMRDGRSLYDSTAWSDLCPVTDFMCIVSHVLVRQNSFDMSSIRLENFVSTGLDSHSVNNKVSVFLVVTQL